jgi:hypothetical protein
MSADTRIAMLLWWLTNNPFAADLAACAETNS